MQVAYGRCLAALDCAPDMFQNFLEECRAGMVHFIGSETTHSLQVRCHCLPLVLPVIIVVQLYKGDDVQKLISESGMHLSESSAQTAADLADPAFEGEIVVLFEFTSPRHWIRIENASSISCAAKDEWLEILYNACHPVDTVGVACNSTEYAGLYSLYEHKW
jgi:hypothetical protein